MNQWTEMEYYLLQELVEMENRPLAAMIELTSFPTSHHPKHWDKFVKALEESSDSEDFYEKAAEVIRDVGAKFRIRESFWHETQDKIRTLLLLAGIETGPVPAGTHVILINGPEVAARP